MHPNAADVAVAALVGVALVTDLTRSRVPNQLTFGGMALGIGMGLTGGTALEALSGIGLALVLMLPGWLLGGAIRAGDAKLLMAVGGFWGVSLALRACVLTYVLSLPAAVAVLFWKGRLQPAHIWRRVRHGEGPVTRVPWVPVVAAAVLLARLSVAP